MKVKTIKEVHIRAKEPFIKGNSNKKGMLYPGFKLNVTEEVQGEEIDNNSIWYKDKNGDYYLEWWV